LGRSERLLVLLRPGREGAQRNDAGELVVVVDHREAPNLGPRHGLHRIPTFASRISWAASASDADGSILTTSWTITSRIFIAVSLGNGADLSSGAKLGFSRRGRMVKASTLAGTPLAPGEGMKPPQTDDFGFKRALVPLDGSMVAEAILPAFLPLAQPLGM